MVPLFKPEITKNWDCPLPETLEAKAGSHDTTFREIATTSHVWAAFTPAAVWVAKKIHYNTQFHRQRHSNCKPGDSSNYTCHPHSTIWRCSTFKSRLLDTDSHLHRCLRSKTQQVNGTDPCSRLTDQCGELSDNLPAPLLDCEASWARSTVGAQGKKDATGRCHPKCTALAQDYSELKVLEKADFLLSLLERH